MPSSLCCPVCDADLTLAGDERVGEQIYCAFCGAPSLLTKKPGSDDESELDVEPDF